MSFLSFLSSIRMAQQCTWYSQMAQHVVLSTRDTLSSARGTLTFERLLSNGSTDVETCKIFGENKMRFCFPRKIMFASERATPPSKQYLRHTAGCSIPGVRRFRGIFFSILLGICHYMSLYVLCAYIYITTSYHYVLSLHPPITSPMRFFLSTLSFFCITNRYN
jgi:hypothetical protein